MVKQSESVTFRISTTLLESLREESLKNNTSLNTLVSQLIIEHETWHKYSKNAGFMSIPKDFQRSLLNKVTKDEIIQITQQKAKMCNSIVSMLRSVYSLDTFLDVIESWFKISNFSYRKDVGTDVFRLTVQHNMGEKWSVFLSTLIQSNLEKLVNEKCVITITDESVSIEIPNKLFDVLIYS